VNLETGKAAPLSTMHRVSGGDPLLFEARENVLGAYQQLRDTHPAFPEVLRDFQADIVAAAINAEDGHHILSSLPTGMGKTLPMIVASCLLPPGSTTMIIVPLTTIKQQLEDDLTRLGISFLVGDQVAPSDLARELSNRPTVLLASAEFLASTEVRDVILKCGLSPTGVRPAVCIDECQVLDGVFGWTGFRPSYANSTWQWLTAAFDPKLLLSSASLSEESLVRVCATLGVQRGNVKVFFKHPQRSNIYQQIRHVEDFSTRLSDASLGFLLPLAAAGKKIQVFCPTLDLTVRASRWAKRRFAEAGLSVPVSMITGNLPVTWKATVMDRFKDGHDGVLFCTDAASMGLNIPDLCVGISLGLPKSRWKMVQITGRVARGPEDMGIFITVVPRKQGFRVSAEEKAEFKEVRKLLSSTTCLNKGMYASFAMKSTFVTYEDDQLQERCERCWCCTTCNLECSGVCGGEGRAENEDKSAMRALGLDIDSVEIAGAEAKRRQFVDEMEARFASQDLDDGEETEEEEEDGEPVGEEEEAV